MTPMNSAIRAYINFASLNLFDGVCSRPGIFAQDSLEKLGPRSQSRTGACSVSSYLVQYRAKGRPGKLTLCAEAPRSKD